MIKLKTQVTNFEFLNEIVIRECYYNAFRGALHESLQIEQLLNYYSISSSLVDTVNNQRLADVSPVGKC